MKVLFICKNNQFRSQMAAALFNKISMTNFADSAGTYVGADDAPEGDIIEKYFATPDFFELMEENGMHIRNNKMKKLTSEILSDTDIVISMAEDPFIPNFLNENKKVQWWDVENPKFATREVSEKTFKQIEIQVKELIENLNLTHRKSNI